ncbi:hypothetical protein EC973_003338 [Apophysomyces ossiformis]|uniref:Uncharacterized protein n=1 Tax=Apophysomyces ossiformis TaxID=679940 RepID=A0A8H7BWA1_9FUNG|nr:hypothetical protein EC973_003338 [Apophysomyces ossiformis]
MYAPSSQRRNLIVVVAVLTLLFTATYFQYASYNGVRVDTATVPVSPAVLPRPPSPKLPSKPKTPTIQTVCDKVDIAWLASDRQYWDGWTSKSMFIKPDGNFTVDDVEITEGETVCVVALLGPVPAASAIQPETHFGPADSIVTTAVGNSTKISVTLQQHPKQFNAYFAPVYFARADDYRLESTTEYRSYFWEVPIYHLHRPVDFSSQNTLRVTKKFVKQSTLPRCDKRQLQQLDGSWVGSATTTNDLYDADVMQNFEFVPDRCHLEEMSSECFQQKTIHVWGDANMRRNLKAIASKDQWCNAVDSDECICNDDGEDVANYPWLMDSQTPLLLDGGKKIYFNPVGSITLSNQESEIAARAKALPPADIVIVSFGNDDIPSIRLTPSQFMISFKALASHLLNDVYPHQPIVVRTPQYFGRGTLRHTSWNAGRSAAFSTVIQQTIAGLNSTRVVLWNTQKLGMADSTCTSAGTPYSRRDIVSIENTLLWNLLCSSS